MTKNTETAVMTIEQRFPLAVDSPESAELMRANLGDGGSIGTFDLQRIRMPAGGGLAFNLEDFASEEAREVEAVILGWRDGRTYWAASYEDSGGGTPPDCSSTDGIEGRGNPGGACASCRFNQWGSATKGSGKACRESRPILLAMPGQLLPALLVVPPSSLKKLRNYMLGLTSARRPYWSVLTRLSLEADKSATGIKYSKMKFALAQGLDELLTARFRALSEQFAPVLEAVSVDRQDVDEP